MRFLVPAFWVHKLVDLQDYYRVVITGTLFQNFLFVGLLVCPVTESCRRFDSVCIEFRFDVIA